MRLTIIASMFIAISLSASAQEVQTTDTLPGYYEFFAKAGKLTKLDAEKKSDELIKSGELKPITVNQPVIDVQLPDKNKTLHSPNNWIGKKNLVLITGRAWW
jgi:hypothetical protein